MLGVMLGVFLGWDSCGEVFRVVRVPVGVGILFKLAGRLGAFIHGRGQDFEVADAIVTDGMSRQW